jgi:hypothetical protein
MYMMMLMKLSNAWLLVQRVIVVIVKMGVSGTNCGSLNQKRMAVENFSTGAGS